MDINNNIRMLFYGDKESAKEIFAYTLIRANRDHYFNPKYNNSELYDLYEDLMIEYCENSNESFSLEDTAKNMEAFFKSGEYLKDSNKEIINEVFNENKNIGRYLKDNYLNSSVFFDYENSPDTALVIDIPVNGTEFLEPKSNILNSIKDQSNNTYSMDEDYDFDEDGNLYEGYRVTEQGKQVVPTRIFSEIMNIVQEEAEGSPDLFQPILTRLRGANEKEIRTIHSQVIVILDIISMSSNYTYEAHWSDIVGFAYNTHGDSLLEFTEYLNEQHLILSEGLPTYMDYEDILAVQKHLVSLTPALTTNNTKVLTSDSQLLLSFVDMISQACALREEGQFDE